MQCAVSAGKENAPPSLPQEEKACPLPRIEPACLPTHVKRVLFKIERERQKGRLHACLCGYHHHEAAVQCWSRGGCRHGHGGRQGKACVLGLV